jgi:regulator of sirC expression with transglutaminase-like and TPR domain
MGKRTDCHCGDWVKELLRNLDRFVDEPTRSTILAACGERCPFTHLPDERLLELRERAEDEQDFLNALCRDWRLSREEDGYYVVFDQCYCPLVNKDMQGTPKTLCACTLGNIKRKFTLVLGRPVEVRMEKTILAGDAQCRFSILI